MSWFIVVLLIPVALVVAWLIFGSVYWLVTGTIGGVKGVLQHVARGRAERAQ